MAEDRDPAWFVLIEQDAGGGDARSPTVTDARPATDYDHARRLARELAWIVVVQGATRSFHFRTIVARWLGDAPR